MDWLYSLFVGGGIAHTVFTLALVITAGILLGKVKVCGISLGITWILFVGIIAAHFGMGIPAEVRHFIQEFGLILFVFSIGMQVGPGFFASFKHGGLTLVCLASTIVLLGVGVAYVIHLVSGTPIPTMVGILSGAVTNTPGLGAAQQAYADASGVEDPSIALGYAVAYPLGVIGIIFSMIFIRYALRVKFGKEDEALAAISAEHKMAEIVSIECTNKMLSGHDISYVNELINRKFVISRIAHPDGTIVLADSNSIISLGDKVLVVCASEDCEAVTAFIGIALGVLLGSIPLLNVPQPVKLGLAGGPLIVALLLGRFGPRFHLVTYTTMSANLMLREVGIALFLAAVGLGAGDGFIDAIVGGGYRWIGYGALITVIPLLLVGIFARARLKMNYYTLMGLMAGSMTDPPALAYANGTAGNDMPALSYSTVYPVVMFLRVLTAQIFILFAL